MEKYMCSRFFIDFADVHTQLKKLETYLEAHFHGNLPAKYEYLVLLYRIVDESTICLMNHERRMTLTMIEHMANNIVAQINYYSNVMCYPSYPVQQHPQTQPPPQQQRQTPTLFYVPRVPAQDDDARQGLSRGRKGH
jgi:hypothetical protein